MKILSVLNLNNGGFLKNKIMSKNIQILILCISILLSILGGIMSSYCDATTLQSITLSILTFITIEFLNVLYYLYTIKFEQKKSEKYWKSYDEESVKLANMNIFYSDILKDSHGENDLFVSYAKKEISNLASRLRDAAEKKIMRISSDYLIYIEGVFDAFNITDKKIPKFTWHITQAQNKIFTSPPDAHFFEVTIDMIKKKRIEKIQVLVILESEKILEEENVKKLFSFFNSEHGYECRYVLESVFTEICNSNGMIIPTLEIGIYGPKMLFTVEKASVHEYQGVYTKDQERVNLATRIFNQTWNSESISNTNPIPADNSITCKDIINS